MPIEEKLSLRFPDRWEFHRNAEGVLTVTWKQPGTTPGGHVLDSLFGPGNEPSLQVADELWAQIGNDYDNKVVILTGHDGKFYDLQLTPSEGGAKRVPPNWDASAYGTILYRVPRSIQAFLDIPTLLIGAANGPATLHAEYLLLCDIVVAAESAVFQDRPHFVSNAVPGDGVNVIWPLLLGWNRGRDFLLRGKSLTAWEAQDLGLVSEVVPDADLLPRCHELAAELLKQDELTLRYTAPALRQQIKEQVVQHVQHGLALEGILKVQYAQGYERPPA